MAAPDLTAATLLENFILTDVSRENARRAASVLTNGVYSTTAQDVITRIEVLAHYDRNIGNDVKARIAALLPPIHVKTEHEFLGVRDAEVLFVPRCIPIPADREEEAHTIFWNSISPALTSPDSVASPTQPILYEIDPNDIMYLVVPSALRGKVPNVTINGESVLAHKGTPLPFYADLNAFVTKKGIRPDPEISAVLTLGEAENYPAIPDKAWEYQHQIAQHLKQELIQESKAKNHALDEAIRDVSR